MSSHLRELRQQGQAPWLDFVERRFLEGGGLKKLIETDGITGVTSNPSIFEKSIANGSAYDEQLAELLKSDPNAEVIALYEALAVRDIQYAADELRPVFDGLAGADGYVSLEVSPRHANDADATVIEAHRLWRAVDRPNLMIKVPGTEAGVSALRRLTEQGINVNVTLLFSPEQYRHVAGAFIEGLEARRAAGLAIDRIASVASFFISRIDAMVDAKASGLAGVQPSLAGIGDSLRGKIAIANAKLAYHSFGELMASERWRGLAECGAMPQRLLWASTGIKNPTYPDTLYVDALIGSDTVNTMPPATMDAFRDHGCVSETLTSGIDEARELITKANNLGFSPSMIGASLVESGLQIFSSAFELLLGSMAEKRERCRSVALVNRL